MAKKFLAMITAGAVMVGGVSTTVFAANGELTELKNNYKAVKEELKQNVEIFRSKKGAVKSAVDRKKNETGFKKIDKTQISPELQALKDVKDQIKQIKIEIASAKESGDQEKAKQLSTELESKIVQAKEFSINLEPYKEQFKINKTFREQSKGLKENLKAMAEERNNIKEENIALKNEIKVLKEQVKQAAQQKNKEEVERLTGILNGKLNKLNDNFIKLNTLKDKAVNEVNEWQSEL